MAQLDLMNPSSPIVMPPGFIAPKADGAYKTISEVSDELDVPQHVLRFWETHFPQIKPSRMRGSRRYYRPQDIETLKTIKTLLYAKGYTIKGAKKVVSHKEPIESMEAPSQRPTATAVATSATAMPAVKAMPAKKNVDKKALAGELRALRSMLTSLL